MKELLELILKKIVNNPEEISVQEQSDEEDPTFIKFLISSHNDDKGIIIGRSGHTISALRNILSIKAIKENKKVRLEIEDK